MMNSIAWRVLTCCPCRRDSWKPFCSCAGDARDQRAHSGPGGTTTTVWLMSFTVYCNTCLVNNKTPKQIISSKNGFCFQSWQEVSWLASVKVIHSGHAPSLRSVVMFDILCGDAIATRHSSQILGIIRSLSITHSNNLPNTEFSLKSVASELDKIVIVRRRKNITSLIF